MLLQDPASPSGPGTPSRNLLGPSNGQLRVLTIDDNVDAATSLGLLVETMGCKSAVAFCGATGLRVTESFRPHLVFVDLHMHGQDGCQVVSRALRLDGPVSRALFVCLTGSGDLSDEQRCLKAGFHHFVRKPIAPETIDVLMTEARARAGLGGAVRAASSVSSTPPPPMRLSRELASTSSKQTALTSACRERR